MDVIFQIKFLVKTPERIVRHVRNFAQKTEFKIENGCLNSVKNNPISVKFGTLEDWMFSSLIKQRQTIVCVYYISGE